MFGQKRKPESEKKQPQKNNSKSKQYWKHFSGKPCDL